MTQNSERTYERRLAGYDLVRKLGAGGMGEVWQARLLRAHGFEKLVAIKMMRTDHVEDESAINMFLDEARLAANINSPHVVSTLDLGISERDELFIVMEYVDGVSLASLLSKLRSQRRRIPVGVALEILRQTAMGLHDAHEALSARGEPLGLIHRDISPDNILIGWDGWAKVIDFGVASGEMRLGVSLAGEVKGKLAYASPEQLRSEPLSRCSDLFSLGVVAWELLSGKRLFQAESTGAVLVKVLTSDAPDIRVERPEVVELVADCIADALKRDSAERLPNAALFAEAMAAGLRELGAEVRGVRDISSFLRSLDGQGRESAKAQPRGDVQGAPSRALRSEEETAVAIRISPDSGSSEGSKSGLLRQSDALVFEHRTNLSPGLDSFVGRRAEVEELSSLAKSGTRLITLTGPGGVGKTRLARLVGQSLVDHFSGGVWFCDLSAIRAKNGVFTAVASALGVKLIGSNPELELRNAIASRGGVLIILDNFEQVLEWGPATVGQWLSGVPECSFLVTSRASLAIQGEHIVPLDPMSISDGVELFFARALAVQPKLVREPAVEARVREIVRELDGLSLAIELAAARMRFLSLEMVGEGLADRFSLLSSKRRDLAARHRTLWGALEWSWNLLETQEREALSQLSIFEDWFDIAAFEAVVHLPSELTVEEKHRVLEALVDQSLIQQDEPSPGDVRYYRLLVSVRSYVRQKAEARLEEGWDALQERFAKHYFKRAADKTLVPIQNHRGNLESAYQFLSTAEAWNEAATVAVAIGYGAMLSGSPLPALERMRSIQDEAMESETRLALWHTIGALSSNANLPDEAMRYFTRGLLEAQKLGDARQALPFLHYLAWEYRIRSDVGSALEMLESCIKTGLQCGIHETRLAFYRVDMGSCYLMRGRFEEATELYEEALECFRRHGHERGVAMGFANLARLFLVRGELDRANELIVSSRELASGGNMTALFYYGMELEGLAHSKRGEWAEAERKWRLAAQKLEHLRPPRAGACISEVALLVASRGDFAEATELMQRASHLVIGKNDIEEAKLLARRARLHCMLEDYGAAKSDHARAASLAHKMGALPQSEVGQEISLSDEMIAGA